MATPTELLDQLLPLLQPQQNELHNHATFWRRAMLPS